MDDIKLFNGLRQRDTAAQQQFWKVYWPKTYAICVRILGKNSDATDLAVDLLTDFIDRRVLDLKAPGAMNAYLRLMAIRRSVDLRQKRSLSTGLDFDIKDTGATTPEEQAELVTLMPRLNNCLSKLTEKAQQTLRLKYTEQWTNEHIGTIVGGSKQYIGRLIRKSLESLKTCIERTHHTATMAHE